jgi:hypothetical protein
LDRQRVGDDPRLGSAEGLRDVDGHQSELCQLAEHLARKPLRGVDVGSLRGQHPRREVARGLLHEELCFVEDEIHARTVSEAALAWTSDEASR